MSRLAALLLALAGAVWGQSARPYVVLVSIDGLRNDYARIHDARNLKALGRDGVTAKAMIPSFPVLTFPNHISIVTGLWPARHGIVANEFLNREANDSYKLSKAAQLGSWVKGKPLWLLAEEQGVKAASMFWPTSDAEIGGKRPSYWKLFDEKFPNEQRIDQVLEWLRLPEVDRPHMLFTYFSDVDNAGHKFGPRAPETRAAVQRIDALIGRLRDGLGKLALPVNLIVVSDHGMELGGQEVILGELTDLSGYTVYSSGPFALIYGPDPERVYRELREKARERFDVYRRSETPEAWHYRDNPRIGDLVVMGRKHAVVRGKRPERPYTDKGHHADDAGREPEMLASFFAAGPGIRHGARLGTFPNVDVYPFIAKLLGLSVPEGIDGNLKALGGVLR